MPETRHSSRLRPPLITPFAVSRHHQPAAGWGVFHFLFHFLPQTAFHPLPSISGSPSGRGGRHPSELQSPGSSSRAGRTAGQGGGMLLTLLAARQLPEPSRAHLL